MTSRSFFAPRRPGTKTTNPSDSSSNSDIIGINSGINSSLNSSINSSIVTTKKAGPLVVRERPCPPRQLPLLASGASWTSKIRFLTPNQSSWILHVPRFCGSSSSKQQQELLHKHKHTTSLEDFWKARPKQRHSLTLFGRKVLENRYSAMYSKDETVGNYAYSGSSRPCKVCDACDPHEKFVLDLFSAADDITGQLLSPTGNILHPSHETSEGCNHSAPKPTHPSSQTAATATATAATTTTPIYNACLVNWYAPEHSIGLHSDDEPELDTSWPIFTFSWGGPRRFLLRPKSKSNSNPKPRDGGASVHEVILKDGDLLVMGGNCQGEFKHEIPKVRSTRDGLVGNRISWTIRRMRPNKKAGKVMAMPTTAAHKASNGVREAGNDHSIQHDKRDPTKRTHGESSKSSNSNKPRKRKAIYNPYARARG